VVGVPLLTPLRGKTLRKKKRKKQGEKEKIWGRRVEEKSGFPLSPSGGRGRVAGIESCASTRPEKENEEDLATTPKEPPERGSGFSFLFIAEQKKPTGVRREKKSALLAREDTIPKKKPKKKTTKKNYLEKNVMRGKRGNCRYCRSTGGGGERGFSVYRSRS